MGAHPNANVQASRSNCSPPRCWRPDPTASRDPSPGPADGGCRRLTPPRSCMLRRRRYAPVSDAKSRDMKKDWDRNYVHSLDWRWLTTPLSDGPGESWIRPEVDLVKGETHDAAGAAVLGGRRRERHRHKAGHPQVDIPEHRSGRAHPSGARRANGSASARKPTTAPTASARRSARCSTRAAPSAASSSRYWCARDADFGAPTFAQRPLARRNH